VVSTSGSDSKTSSHSGSVVGNNNSSTNNVSVAANGDSISREDSGTGTTYNAKPSKTIFGEGLSLLPCLQVQLSALKNWEFSTRVRTIDQENKSIETTKQAGVVHDSKSIITVVSLLCMPYQKKTKQMHGNSFN